MKTSQEVEKGGCLKLAVAVTLFPLFTFGLVPGLLILACLISKLQSAGFIIEKYLDRYLMPPANMMASLYSAHQPVN